MACRPFSKPRRLMAVAQPELEIIVVDEGEPFKIWSHGYPFRTVRWHFHPEFEIHLITTTSGRVFVGDYIGAFAPGNLVMTGPNLPHNWLSDVAPGVVIPQRCIVLQFGAGFIEGCASLFPGLDLAGLIDDSQRGLEFTGAASAAVTPLMRPPCWTATGSPVPQSLCRSSNPDCCGTGIGGCWRASAIACDHPST